MEILTYKLTSENGAPTYSLDYLEYNYAGILQFDLHRGDVHARIPVRFMENNILSTALPTGLHTAGITQRISNDKVKAGVSIMGFDHECGFESEVTVLTGQMPDFKRPGSARAPVILNVSIRGLTLDQAAQTMPELEFYDLEVLSAFARVDGEWKFFELPKTDISNYLRSIEGFYEKGVTSQHLLVRGIARDTVSSKAD